jgi:acyl-coenzyme A thioesterase 13
MNPVLEFFKSNIGKYASEMGPAGIGRWLNGKLIAVEEGSLSVEFEVKAEMLNPVQILHGGIGTTMMDDVIGMTAFSLGRKDLYVSVNLNVDFLRPAKLGDKIIAKSQLIRGGDMVLHFECQLLHQDGKIIAKTASNMIKSPLTPGGGTKPNI